MKSNKAANLVSILVIVANLVFPGVAAAAPQPVNNWPIATSASLSALPDWFTAARPSRLTSAAEGSLRALPSWFTAPTVDQPASSDRQPGGFAASERALETSSAVEAGPAKSALPAWFAPAASAPQASEDSSQPAPVAGGSAAPAALPGWFSNLSQPSTSPSPQASYTHIDESLLTIDVSGPSVANAGAPIGAGELYTAVIQNSSAITVYSVYLTATHQTYFSYDSFSQMITRSNGLTGSVPFTVEDDNSTAITWTPSITVDLLPHDVLTLNFTLRADCGAQSAQQMRIGLHYLTSLITPTYELNEKGLNITTGRGNLVISKSPSIQPIDPTQYGHPITWLVTVQNTGLGALFSATVTDTGGISLTQPTGSLIPSVTIPRLEVNESKTFTVTGLINACNFTNIAKASWICGNGNVAGDGYVTNPVSSTAGVLFKPNLPNITLQVAPADLVFTYCSSVSQTVVVSVTNSGGPAGSFVISSDLNTDGFLQIDPASVNADWQYANGAFTYLGGAPTGTIPAQTSAPITLTFKVWPKSPVCLAGNGSVKLNASYKEVCSGDAYRTPDQFLTYHYAEGEAPDFQVSKSSNLPASRLARPGDVITYVVQVAGVNPNNLKGPIFVSDTLPGAFQITGTVIASRGNFTPTGQNLSWTFTPSGTPFTETLTYAVQVVDTKNQCNAASLATNSVVATAAPSCASCNGITRTDQSDAVIVNNEGIQAGQGGSGTNAETCGLGFTFVNSYTVAGSTIVTWTGAFYTDSLGIGLGYGGLPDGASPLYLVGGVSATISGTSYLLTPTRTISGQLSIDLEPLDAQHAPTQNLTLIITYNVAFTEGILLNSPTHSYSQSFYDWTQLYLPNVSSGGCATNNAYNQARYLTVDRGELQVSLWPTTINQCQTTHVRLTVSDLTGRNTHDAVITFTASAAQIASISVVTFTGNLNTISPITVTTNTALTGGQGIITFTLPPAASTSGGTIEFNLEPNCKEKPAWTAGISFQTRCNIPHRNSASPNLTYNSPGLGLFVTPIEYTIDKKDVVWWVLVSNQGTGPATNIQVTNTLSNLSIVTYTTNNSSTVVSLNGTQPLTSANPAVFTVSKLDPNESVLIAYTATVARCDPLGVKVTADLSCFGETCQTKAANVQYNAPPVYLTSNNGQSADLPMCALGYILFRTKNASPDATLYNATITETLVGLAPALGYPLTLTIYSVTGTVIASTTSFTPTQSITGNSNTSQFTTTLVWKYDSPWANGILDALPPQAQVVVAIPVILGCSAGTPKAQADASMFGPCNVLKTAHEDAITLQTRQPDMSLTKRVQDITTATPPGSNIAANPGDTIVWRLHLVNNNTSHSYPAQNVVLTDTWPSNFIFSAASSNITTPVTAGQTITWNIGTMQIGDALDFFITGTVQQGTTCQGRTINYSRVKYGCDNGCVDGLAPIDQASLDTNPDVTVDVSPGPLEACGGDIPVIIHNYGARAYTPTLVITLPAGFIYSNVVSVGAGLTLTDILTGDSSAPQFQFASIPERTTATSGNSNPTHAQITAPFSATLVIHVKNSGTSGICPVAAGRVVSASIGYDNQSTCTDQGPFAYTATSQALTVQTPALQISKEPHTQISRVGETITWTVTLSNAGTGLAENTVVTDVAGGNYTNLTSTVNAYGLTPQQINASTLVWIFTTPITANSVWTAEVSAVLTSTGSNLNTITATTSCASGCQGGAVVTDTALTTLVDAFGKGPKIQTGTIGSLAAFTFTALLPAQRPYGSIAFTDTLPPGLGYVSSTLNVLYDDGAATILSSTPTLSPTWLDSGALIWLLGDLTGTVQVNGFVTTVVQNTSTNQSPLSLTNVVTMSYSDTGQPYIFTDTAQVDVREPALARAKVASSSTGSLNNLDGSALLTYTLAFTNTGASTAYDVLLTDTVPAGISVTALLDGYPHTAPIQGPGDLTWTVASIDSVAPGNVVTLTYTAIISGAAASSLGNTMALVNAMTATYSSLPGNPFPEQERSYGPITATQTIHTARAVTGKTVTPFSDGAHNVKVGDVLTYTIVNTVPAGLVALWPYQFDYLPDGVRYVTGSLAVNTNLPFAGASLTDTLTAPFASAVYPGLTGADDRGVLGLSAAANPNVGAMYSDASRQAVEWWFQSLNNAGQTTAGLVTVTFQAQVVGTRLDTGAELWAGAQQPQSVGPLANSETLNWIEEAATGYTTTQPTLQDSSVANSYVGQPRLNILKTAQPASGSYVGSGDTLTYSLIITNDGRAPAYNLVISDVLPAGITYADSSLTSTTPVTAAFTFSPAVNATGLITWSVDTLNGFDLSANPRLTVTVVTHVDPAITANVRLTNTVTLPYYDTQPGPGPQTGLTPTQRTYSDGASSVWHQTVAGRIAKGVSFSPPPTATLGSIITYVITAPSPAISATLYNVVITDQVDSRLLVLTATAGGGVGALVTTTGQALTATFTSIPHDAQGYITVTGRLSVGLGAKNGDIISNSAVLTYDTASAITTTNVVTTVVGEPALTITKAVASSTGNTGNLNGNALLTYTLRLTNTGTSPAYSVLVTDAIPAGISVTAQLDANKHGALVAGPGVLTWTVDTIPNGASVALSYTAVLSQALANSNLVNAVTSTYWSLTDTTPGAKLYSPITATRTVSTANLALSKASTPGVLKVGDVVTYSLVFTVPAGLVGLGAPNSYLTDTLPAGVQFTNTDTLTWTPASVGVFTTTAVLTNISTPSQVLTWTFGAPITSVQDLPTVVTLTFQAEATGVPVNGGAQIWSQAITSTLVNTATLIQRGQVVSQATASNSVIQPTLLISKTSTPPSGNYVGAGQTITYALVVTNSTYGPAYDIVISDVLPAGVIYDSSSLSCTTPLATSFAFTPAGPSASGVITWEVAAINGLNLSANPRLTVTVVTHADPAITANVRLTNTASIPYYDSQPGAGPQTGLTPTQRVYNDGSSSVWHQTSNVSLVKTVAPATATLGSVVTYIITVPQPAVAATVYTAVITDVLDAKLQLSNVVTDGVSGTVDKAGNAFTVTYGSIPASQQRLITVTAIVSSPSAAAGNLITNVAFLSYTTGLTQSLPAVFTVTEPSLSPFKASNVPATATVAAGQSVTYTIRLTNTNFITTSAAYDLLITDTLPLGMRQAAPAILGASINGAAVGSLQSGYTSATGLLTVTLPTTASIPPNQSLVLSYTATVDPNAPAGLRMTNLMSATYWSLSGGVPGDRNYGPITATTPLTTPMATTLIKAVTPATATIGSQVVFTLAVPGARVGAVLNNMVVTDTIDSRLSIVTADTLASTGTLGIAGQTVTASLGSIAANGQAYITITASIRDLVTVTQGTQISNVAQMNYTGNSAGPITSNLVTVTVAEPRVTLAKSVQTPRSPVGAGDTVTYTLALTNTGNWPAYDLIITDALPSGVNFGATQVVTLTDPLTASRSGDYPAWTVSQLNIGGHAYITFTARVSDAVSAAATLTNRAWGQSDTQPGPTTGERVTPTLTSTVDIQTGLPRFTLVKTAAPSPAPAGGPLVYTLTVTNTGIVSATGVIITDRVPLSTTYQSCGPSGVCGQAAGIVSWTVGTVDIGSPRSVTMAVAVDMPLLNGTILTNTAWVTSTEGASQTTSLTTSVSSTHTLAVAKWASPAPVQAGSQLTYTLAYTVAGNEPALGVMLSDTVPQSTTYSSCAPGPCSQSGGLILWNVGALYPNPSVSGVATLVVTVNTPLITGTSIVNTVVVTDANGGIPKTDTITTPVVSQHTLMVHKSASSGTVQPAGLLTYTLAYTIAGNEPALGVTVSDAVPAHTTFYTSPQPYTQSGNLITWQIGNFLAAASGLSQQTGVVTMVVQADTPLTNGLSLVNTVLVTDTNHGLTTTDTVTTIVVSQHALSVTKAASANLVAPGGLLTYTINYTVTGDETALGAIITDLLPVNTNFVTTSQPYAGPTGGVITWPLASPIDPLGASNHGTITLVVTVTEPLADGTVLTNNVAISDTNNGLTATHTITTLVGSHHWLAVTKSAAAQMPPGGWLTYTINYTVTGNEIAQNAIITDRLPANTVFITTSQPYSGPTGGVITWPLASAIDPLGASNHGAIILVVTATSPLPNGTLLINGVGISDTNQGYTSTNSFTTTIVSTHTLALAKSVSAAILQAGGQLTYTLAWGVSGDETALGLTLSDALPANTRFLGVGPSGSFDGAVVTWALGNQDPGASGAITFTVQVTAPLPNNTVITNTGLITDANGGVPQTAYTTTVVQSQHTLVVHKSASSGTVQPNALLTYTLAYTATGDDPALGVTLADVVPAHTIFYDSPQAYTLAGNAVIWQVGDLIAASSGLTQETGVVTMVVQVDTPLTNGLGLVNSVLITDTTGKIFSDTLTVPVVAQHVLTLTKSASPDPVQAGDLLTYTLDYTVTGDAIATGVTLSDTVPPNTSYNACAPLPCGLIGGRVTWPLGSLIPPASGTAMLLVRVASPLVSGTQIVNTAVITDSEDISSTGANTTTVMAMPDLAILKTYGGPAATPGGTVTYTLAYSNIGNQTAVGVIITETVPTNTVFNGAASHPGWTPVGGGVYTFLVGAVNPAGVVTFGVTLADPLPAGVVSITNTATIGDNGVETNTLNNSSTLTTPVTSAVALQVTKNDGLTLMWPGSVVTYVIRFTNTGNIAATNVTLTETVPTYTVFNAGASLTPWSCTDGSGPGTVCTTVVPSVAGRGGAGSVTFAVTATSPFPPDAGPVTNTVFIDTNPTPAVDVDLPVLPRVAMQKVLASNSPAYLTEPITFAILITNTGPTTLTTIPLTDTFDSAHLALVGAAPAPSAAGASQLQWNNVLAASGNLAPGHATTVTVVMQAIGITPPGLPATNTATVNGVIDIYGQRPPGNGSSSQVGVIILPNLAISKQVRVTTYRAGDPITFTIQITNLGATTILTLPLVDTYDPAYLGYLSASPASSSFTPGQITWTNLAAGPTGLLPHNSLSVQVVFTAVAPVTDTVNTAAIVDAIDNRGNHLSATAGVNLPIQGPPTAVRLLYFRIEAVEGTHVRLVWETAAEIDNYGFNLYRAPANDRALAELIHFEPSGIPGGSGAGQPYRYTDDVPAEGIWWYWLADVDTHGQETFHAPVSTNITIENGWYKLYLPLVQR